MACSISTDPHTAWMVKGVLYEEFIDFVNGTNDLPEEISENLELSVDFSGICLDQMDCQKSRAVASVLRAGARSIVDQEFVLPSGRGEQTIKLFTELENMLVLYLNSLDNHVVD